ncbi:5-methyltetrahydropteroyltriglutamate--homocysteine S-methyltransferase [Leptotrichia sp. OH3620_COT-345]|uniref:5-methyltetrahydropteroyltriglutamate-- homocysteine S-methyltransferase n=1 Tax=Leptotrichia sp. OH3620_COT-345 TaxID=2491048 RepID=UPI000F64D252|nr:5-methyltetrahydropteroyltriglutamate--homocysteine S-methyltransferase [Leptotrichia sp. OH3620_COT-345]RRD40428.1 5-methyltetrahydropteroyltriglutamate--homocysteine S-methyltransferase [Leptotrichia sp. OH3620_COT-345]
MKTAIVGYPRIGKNRELKFAIEKYWKKEQTKEELVKVSDEVKNKQWKKQKEEGINYIPSNTFSFYDQVLDTLVMLGAVPEQYKNLGLDELDTYFAMARGYQGEKGDVKALSMRKWYNTNYHYIVPELEDNTQFKLNGDKLFGEYEEALKLGVETHLSVIGPFTFLNLAVVTGKKEKSEYIDDIISVYIELIRECSKRNIKWIQIDEPQIVKDQTEEDVKLFEKIYTEILKNKGNVKVLLQTYFGDIRDCYEKIVKLEFNGIGLDFTEGKYTLKLVENNGFPEDKYLFAGLVNGKNIWKSDYKKALKILEKLKQKTGNIVLTTSCSLLHVPYTVENETELSEEILKYFSFGEEKLSELKELSELGELKEYEKQSAYIQNQEIINSKRSMEDKSVIDRVKELKEEDFIRKGKRSERQKIQRKELGIPLFPTTTIGSFPQTTEVKLNRSSYRKGEITREEYDKKVFEFIKECIELQEKIGLDILVHGEFERNDMVEFFGENLSGYVFTSKAWVQSYGTRCVKPPIIFGDIKRTNPITILYSNYAQSITEKPVKGMLTGPVTILNWSFPREDISLSEMAYQIGLAIREEVLELQKSGIGIIQIDEAALREKLPLRKSDWHSEYLDWALKSFRLCHSGVKEKTQIHTHMCYSQFEDIIRDIDNMDADVITFEASRSKLTIIDFIKENNFETEIGPGVYDIHSPRVPSTDEMLKSLNIMLEKIDREKLWVNPDCGLKTRSTDETVKSLKNLVRAAEILRKKVE